MVSFSRHFRSLFKGGVYTSYASRRPGLVPPVRVDTAQFVSSADHHLLAYGDGFALGVSASTVSLTVCINLSASL